MFAASRLRDELSLLIPENGRPTCPKVTFSRAIFVRQRQRLFFQKPAIFGCLKAATDHRRLRVESTQLRLTAGRRSQIGQLRK